MSDKLFSYEELEKIAAQPAGRCFIECAHIAQMPIAQSLARQLADTMCENERLLITYRHAIDCLEKANANAAKNGLSVYALGIGGGGVTPNKHPVEEPE